MFEALTAIHKKTPLCGAFFMDGAPGEIRTSDRSVRSSKKRNLTFYKTAA
jgi:hypothetical protein